LYVLAILGWVGAGRHETRSVACDNFHHADPAGAGRWNSRVMAKRRNLLAGKFRRSKDGSSWLYFDLLTIYR
jgi:hypothetical protein